VQFPLNAWCRKFLLVRLECALSRFSSLCRALVRLLFAVSLGILFCVSAQAEPLELSERTAGPLGERASYLIEGRSALDLRAASNALRRGEFRTGGSPVASYGIGAPPVWIHLALLNPGDKPVAFRAVVGKTWIDHLDVYLVHSGDLLEARRVGDAFPGAAAVVPGVGFVFPIQFPPGGSELFIRAQTVDPLVLPLSLLPEEKAEASEMRTRYGYGLLYGFLLAFIIYNSMLFSGLRVRSYLYYALYLLSFIALSLTYTGHGYAWLWPEYPALQRYVILVMMIAFGCSGFLFASHFLQLELHAPRIRRWIIALSVAAILLMALFAALDRHADAALLAFNFVLVFSAGMVLLGILAVSSGWLVSRYFLAAALCSMAGVASTALSVRGMLPMNALTFHGVEIGIMLEATLLSLALASSLRYREQARRDAEYLARIDALTGLPNRRAFFQDAAGIWNTAVRHNRPLSVIMLDIDHFKSINDQFGHQIGDRSLVEVARLLAQNCRLGDILSRWGGEEFVLLLPETDLEQARALSERIRHAIEKHRIAIKSHNIQLSVSLGAAQRKRHATLEELIGEADRWLYDAKRRGRNQVSSPPRMEHSF
jgi:diguanylate cyclase (GGDEF)-like protein